MSWQRSVWAASASLALLMSMDGRAQVTSVAGTPAAFSQGAERKIGPIHIVPVRGNVYMLGSESGNSTVQIGPQGVLVVDTISAAMASPLLEAIRSLSDRPILQVINTNADRVGGNEVIRNAGRNVAPGTRDGAGAAVLAHEAVLNRLSAEGSQAPRGVWPSDTFFTAGKDLFFNGEPVHVIHQSAAYSDGDSLVLFRRSDVLSAGDVFVPQGYPRIDVGRGGSINGVVSGLNRIIELTVPEVNEEGGTMVVPGSGRLTDEADVAEYRDMVTIVRDRVQDMVRRKMTLQQVVAAKPTLDYDPVYSSTKYTGERFVEAVYRSLSATMPTEKASKK